MGLGKVASNSAFKQTSDLTGGADKKVFRALSKAKINKKRFAIEILWFFAALLIAFVVGFLVFYLIGEYLTASFTEYIKMFDSATKFYFWIFLFCVIGVYITRLIVWAIKTVAVKE